MECNLPTSFGLYPAAPNEWAVVGKSEAKESLFVQQFCEDGYLPVKKDIRAGTHKGDGVYALSKVVPFAANLSKFGVRTISSP
jgi:hypothetical protein